MRKKQFIIISLAIILLFSMTGCTKEKTQNVSSDLGPMITAYYTNKDATEIFAKEVGIPYDKADSDADKLAAVTRLLENVEDGMYSIIGDGLIRKMNIRVDETVVPMDNMAGVNTRILQVELSAEYEKLTGNQKTVFRNCFAQTVFSAFLADRIEYTHPAADGGITTDIVSSQDRIYINRYGESFFDDHIQVTLYFMNEDRTKLVKEDRTLSLGMTEPLSMAIMKALIEGPKEEGHLPTIPDGTKVTDIVLEEGVCYVDLSAEFQLNHEGTEQLEKLTIYSVVNSLSSVRQIDQVQFLINGEKVPYYKSYVQIDHFLQPDMELVQEEN